jgi:restriction system protein
MPIPDYQAVMLPLLRLVSSEGKIHLREAINLISNEFNLTESERNELLPSGTSRIIDNRVGWARTYLKKAGLMAYPQRGFVEITDKGRQVLAENPSVVNVKFLKQFPEFVAFQTVNRKANDENSISRHTLDTNGTPEEVLEGSFQELKDQLLDDVLDKVKSCSPQFFESLVVDTLVKMGYGGSRKDAGRAIGQSGDEGIDGIINEDRLGLDVIYVQAKRWEGECESSRNSEVCRGPPRQESEEGSFYHNVRLYVRS